MATKAASRHEEAQVLLISEVEIAAEFICRAEEWLEEADPRLAREAAALRAGVLRLVEELRKASHEGSPKSRDD